MVDIASFPVASVIRTAAKVVNGDDPSLQDAFFLVSGIGALGQLKPDSDLKQDEYVDTAPDSNDGAAPAANDGLTPTGAINPVATPPDVLPIINGNKDKSLLEIGPETGSQPVTPDQAREYAVKKLTPSLGEQLAADTDLAILDARVMSEHTEIIDGEKRDILVVRQEVVDARYIEYGNLLDVAATLRTGEIPTVDEIILAMVDVLDAVTLEMIRPQLLRWKVESHKGIKDVNVTLRDIRSNHKETIPESTYSDAHEWKIEKPGTDVNLDIRQHISVQDECRSNIQAYQITFEHHEARFGGAVGISESGRVTETDTEATIFEETVETRRVSEGVTATADVERSGRYTLYGPVQIKNEERSGGRIYTTDRDVSFAVKDGILSREELESLNACLVADRSNPTTVAMYREPGKSEYLPPDSQDTRYPVVANHTMAVQPVALGNDTQANTFQVLENLTAQVKTGQTLTMENGFEAGQAIGAIHDNHLAMSGVIDSSRDDSMRRSHVDSSTEEKSKVTGVRDVERPWLPDQRVESLVNTKSEHKLQTDIQATQVNYTETIHQFGPLSEGAAKEIVATKESLAVIVVNEADSTVTTESRSDRTTSTVFGKDVGGFLGKTEEKGQTYQYITGTPTQRVYEVRDEKVIAAIADGKLSQTEINEIGARLVSEESGETLRQSQLIDQGGNIEFKEGWTQYLPMGSVVSAGMKSSYGIELSGSDYFWAAVDSVGTVATFGAGAAASAALRTAGRGIAKGVMKGNLETMGKAIVKGGQKGAEVMGHEMAQRGKEFLQISRAGEKNVENIAKEEFRKTGKVIAREAEQAGKSVILKTREQVLDAAEFVGTLWNKTVSTMLGKKSVGSRSGRVAVKKGAGEVSVSTITGSMPNTQYTINGYHYTTDGYGRTKSVKGKLDLIPGQRDIKNQMKAGKMGQPGDDGGHLIGVQFNGPKDTINVVPQNANLNRGEWKSMEMDWKRHVQDGKTINVDIRPRYTGDSVRPSTFVVRYEVDGKMYRKTFINEIPRDTITTLAAVKGSQEGLKQAVQES